MSAIINYFANHWQGGSQWSITNVENITSKIDPSETVLDVGCGYNPFKKYIGDRLYAFDPAISAGDEMCTVEDFNPKGKQWDVVLCMGSINFGSEEEISAQIKKVVSCVKTGGRIYWRQNPGQADHGNEECKLVNFFPWTLKHNLKFAADNSCYVIDFEIDPHLKNSEKQRLYAEWIKH